MFTKVLIFLVLTSKTCSTQSIKSYLDISNGTRLPNGDVVFNGVTYSEKEYFIEDNVTKIDECAKKTCIRKCKCGFGFAYDRKSKKCKEIDELFNPPIWDEDKVLRDAKVTDMFHFVFGPPVCKEPEANLSISILSTEWNLKKDGQLDVKIEPVGLPSETYKIPSSLLYGPDKYCIDSYIVINDEGQQKIQLDGRACYTEIIGNKSTSIAYSACMLVSCVFILATLAVYSWLPELRSLHGKVLMAYLLCLFTSFMLVAIVQLLLFANIIDIEYCPFLTFITYFSLLSAFFWLNVMSFDIWWTFSGKRGNSQGNMSTNARFLAYAAYAFGVPSVLTLLLIILEYSGLKEHPLLPNIRLQGCFLHGMSVLVYLYGPMGLLCVANIIFFILTAVKINQVKKQTSVLKSKDSTTHDQERHDHQRYQLMPLLNVYIKLFVLMGVSWLLEVISAVTPVGEEVWWLTDGYNVLIGVFIFIIFVCKRKVLDLIKKRLSLSQLSTPTVSSGIEMNSRSDINSSNQNVSGNTAKSKKTQAAA